MYSTTEKHAPRLADQRKSALLCVLYIAFILFPSHSTVVCMYGLRCVLGNCQMSENMYPSHVVYVVAVDSFYSYVEPYTFYRIAFTNTRAHSLSQWVSQRERAHRNETPCNDTIEQESLSVTFIVFVACACMLALNW